MNGTQIVDSLKLRIIYRLFIIICCADYTECCGRKPFERNIMLQVVQHFNKIMHADNVIDWFINEMNERWEIKCQNEKPNGRIPSAQRFQAPLVCMCCVKMWTILLNHRHHHFLIELFAHQSKIIFLRKFQISTVFLMAYTIPLLFQLIVVQNLNDKWINAEC